jgi:hypothetical protein
MAKNMLGFVCFKAPPLQEVHLLNALLPLDQGPGTRVSDIIIHQSAKSSPKESKSLLSKMAVLLLLGVTEQRNKGD